jgi:hypothetical protein
LRHLEDRIADWFWPGFSSRTTRIGYYVMVLHGLHLAERASEVYELPRDDDTRRYFFSRYERLWGLSQFIATKGAIESDDEMLAIDGFIAAFAQKQRNLPIDFRHLQQGEVGALGAYLPSLRAHRLVASENLRLTPLGWDIAQSMWDEPQNDPTSWNDFILKALDPRNTKIPKRVGAVDIKAVGNRVRLSTLAGRSDIQALLWKRLVTDHPPPSVLAVLSDMADRLRDLFASGITKPREILEALAHPRASKNEDIKGAARIALCLSDLGTAMLQIFDRVHQILLAEGYAADWSDCVQAAVTTELVADLNARMSHYRELKCNEQIEDLSIGGRVFGQVMRRFNTQNPYNTFESILNLHTGSNRSLGKGEGWIGRVGETVYLRQASTEQESGEALHWQPTYRMPTMQRLLEEMGQLQ